MVKILEFITEPDKIYAKTRFKLKLKLDLSVTYREIKEKVTYEELKKKSYNELVFGGK